MIERGGERGGQGDREYGRAEGIDKVEDREEIDRAGGSERGCGRV